MNVPAALGPAHLGDVIATMEQALSPYPEVRVGGEATLQQCMKLPGFACLCMELLQQPLADATRLMAALSLKNAVTNSWVVRGSRQFSISADEKVQVRLRLLQHMEEPNKAVATQLAVTVARIARHDFPKEWPDLFGALRDIIQQGSPLQQARALRVLKAVVKELATRRLMAHRIVFNDMSVVVCPFIAQLWQRQVQALTTAAADDVESVLTSVLLSTKVLHHLVLHGFKALVPLDVVPFVFTNFYQTFQALVAFTHRLTPESPALGLSHRVLTALTGLVVAVQKEHPIEFRDYLGAYPHTAQAHTCTGPFLQTFYTTLSEPRTYPDKLVIHLLSYLTNVMGCHLYQHLPSATGVVRAVITAAGSVDLTDAMVAECQQQLGAFMHDPALLSSLLELIVVRYLRLTAADLEQWQEDPEGFVTLQESLSASDSVRACAEVLFLSLLQTHREMLTPCVLRMIESASAWLRTPLADADENAVLRVDAVLLGAGLASYDLHESFDFEPWFLQTLVPYLQQPTALTLRGVPVLSRRIVWLIGCWLAQLSAQVRIPLYEALVHLLAADAQAADTAVKCGAVQTLESLVNDWGFQSNDFVPFLPRAIDALFAFLVHADVESTDTRLKILGCVESIAHMCAGAMTPAMLVQIVNPLPAIWEAAASADANLLRGKVLSLLSRIMEIEVDFVLDAELQTMVLSVVAYATNPDEPEAVYLMDQGLLLWLRLTEVVEVYAPPFHNTFSNILTALARDTEHAATGLQLCNNYLAIGGATFWAAYGPELAQLLAGFLGAVKPEMLHSIARLTEKLCRHLPADALGPLGGVLRRFWDTSIEEPRQEPELVVVSYLTALATASLHTPALFFSVLATDGAVAQYADVLLRLYFSIASTAIGPVRRRTWVCSLCSLMTTHPALTLERLGLILEAAVEALEDEPGEPDIEVSTARKSLLWQFRAASATNQLSCAYIKQFVCGQLNALAAAAGPEAFGHAMALVEASVVAKIQAL
ncbi:importin-like protein [Achlya hypogyna]|uniref:Importin-like protein n=1 Tax=Achlya hypogyna TaxID=1202772 RepID=A0A1V9YZ41_ACHHY|nr:importin-like protein [Achlya hypogyna]